MPAKSAGGKKKKSTKKAAKKASSGTKAKSTRPGALAVLTPPGRLTQSRTGATTFPLGLTSRPSGSGKIMETQLLFVRHDYSSGVTRIMWRTLSSIPSTAGLRFTTISA